VGAIHDLVPAAELVHRFVAEAEAAVDRIAAARAAISSAVTHPTP
jgi:hypothetical protein